MVVAGFEQFTIGQVFTSGSRSLDAAAIKAFAADFDFQPQHVDEQAAKATLFGSLVASGWHTGSLTMRLMLESVLAGVSGRGMGVRINDISWSSPVHPGDALYAVSEIMDVRASRSKPDRGIVVIHTTTRNQRHEPVQEMTGTLIILRSDAET